MKQKSVGKVDDKDVENMKNELRKKIDEEK